MTTEKKWYIVYIKKNSEKRVIESLSRKKIETYFPLNRVRKRQGNGEVLITEPLFQQLLFVHIMHHELSTVNELENVLNFLYWLNNYAIIADEDVQAIKLFLSNYTDVWLEKINLPEKKFEFHVDLQQTSLDKFLNPSSIEKILIPSIGYYLSAYVKIKADKLQYAI